MIASRSMLWPVVLAGIILATDAQESGGPVIVSPSKSEIILQSDQNYTLICRSPRPINFEQQEIPEEPGGKFKFVTRNGTSKNESEYWVAIDLFNVDRYAVGYYACFDDTINSTDKLQFIFEELENKTKHVAYTYVYVNGSSLVAPLNSLVVAKGDSKFLVECKPTSPDITVNLSLDSEHIQNDRYSYNPKVGFYVDSNVLSSSGETYFTMNCDYLKKGNSDTVDLVVHKLLATAAPPPTIKGEDPNFLEGETFTINCTVPKQKTIPVDLQWTFPESADTGKIKFESNSYQTLDSNSTLFKSITVYNASIEEEGVYVCKRNNDAKTSRTFTKKYLVDPVLDVTKRSEEVTRPPSGSKFTSLVAYIHAAYPAPNVTVYRDNIIIQAGADRKYKAKQEKTMYTLKIFNLSAEDTGQYIFYFSNGYLNKSLVFPLEYSAAPQILSSNTEKRYVKGTRASIQCEVIGFPLPDVQWEFTDEDGVKTALVKSGLVDIKNTEKAKYKLVSTLILPVSVSGNVKCIATNEEGKDEADQRFLVYEMENGFGIENAEKMWYSEGDAVVLKCFASIYDFVNVTWVNEYDEEMPVVKRTEDRFSLIAYLAMDPISVAQEGLYTCMGTRNDGKSEFCNVTVTVARIQPPKFLGPEEETLTVNEFVKANISCIVDAVPPPKIDWYKDGSLLSFTNEIRNETKALNLTAVNATITIYPMQHSYGGEYECRVTSKDNEARKTFNLIVNDQTTHNKIIYISVAGVIFFFLILLVMYLAWKIRKEKQFRKELAAAGLLYFKEGVTKSINPDLGIDEQAELLPYDDRFEFPAEKLTLGKQLGAGAFGVVYKAEARGIINAEESTTVAVKMVKKTADNMYIKALASELKIMVHLGKHINIVNLLGACTKNVGKRELIVIVEYCKFGNIHNYLQKHREVFIDQLNDNSEKSLGKVNRGYSCSSGNSSLTSDYFGSNHTQQTDNTFLNTANTNRSGRKDNQTPKETQTKQVDLAKVSESGYVQPEWRSNYESDYSFDGRSPRPLCSRDLLAWSFQIARGMEYLASRKILHGDLAARNILLAEDNVVKICDFGLARSIYKNDEYQKKENSPLPVKWLAIECMTDRIFTTQSDVWSFGIVLWEIFSLAKTPYPNISPPSLLQWLAEGHRLEKPAHADEKLYDLMKRCWFQKPTTRPTFTQLQEIIGSFLEDNVRNHYVDLNATYIDMNVKQAGEEDYLAMVSAPDYNNLVTPSPHHYVNEARSFFPATPTQLQHDDEGYLQMSPAARQTLFNARVQGTKFDFDARKLTPRIPEANSYGSESTPMLTLNNLARSGSESDHEGNSSPYMNMCTKIEEETDDDVFGTKENNAKNIQPIAVSNPTYITLSIDDEKKPQNFANNYININVPNGLVK